MMVPPPRLVLIGHPNVGKSRLFNLLTGSYAVVSNYPGTTVELTRGRGKVGGRLVEIIDTPGIYSLHALSREEEVTRLMLLKHKPALVVQVIEARNLPRMLSLTLELVEAELPLVLVVNMMDEARASGIRIKSDLLSRRLGVPVVPTVLVTGSGLSVLRRAISTALFTRHPPVATFKFAYPPEIEARIREVSSRLQGRYGLSRRAVAVALFNPDQAIKKLIMEQEGTLPPAAPPSCSTDPFLVLAAARGRVAARLAENAWSSPGENGVIPLAERLHHLLVQPFSGGLVLLFVLYWGFYKFVGIFGAGTLVSFLEERVLQNLVLPRLAAWGESLLPWAWLQRLLLADYGLLNLGLRYTFSIILPIMATFFLFFSLVEDSGYLPRAAYLVNKYMEKIGLNGKAVIPLTLGFGCGTLAVLVTRTLESRRERLQASLLLSLAVPCSAQLGLIIALLAPGKGLLIWLVVIGLAFYAAAKLGRALLGSEGAPFCLELPPLRVPRAGAVVQKTVARLFWYLKEVWPLFICISLFLWLMDITGMLQAMLRSLAPLARLWGLPEEAVLILVYGFIRRDYGAAGLFDLARDRLLDGDQILVLAVILTLFLPCLAQLLALIKEHGLRFALLVIVVTVSVAGITGFLVRLLTVIF